MLNWSIKSFSEFKFYAKADLYRYHGKINFILFFRYLALNPGYKFSFYLRSCQYTRYHSIFKYFIFPVARIQLRRFMIKYGIQISYKTKIGPGLYIGHFGEIVVNSMAQIGKNCNLSHGVTIGIAGQNENRGVPIIGNNVYIGPGAKIVGKINIGDNVVIGANCVVTKDVPDYAIIAGVPGKIIKMDYDRVAKNTDYKF